MLTRLIIGLIAFTTLLPAQPLVVGIAGGTGSGKTTLARKIQEAFPTQTTLISQDSYYRPLDHLSVSERAKANFDHPDSLDFTLLATHLRALKEGKSIEKPVYNFHSHARELSTESVSPNTILIVEGILLYAVPEIRSLCDFKLFVDTDDDVRVLRRIERDIQERSRTFPSVKEQYLSTVKLMHDTFVEPSKRYADLIIPHGGENAKALELILSKLREEIEASDSLLEK